MHGIFYFFVLKYLLEYSWYFLTLSDKSRFLKNFPKPDYIAEARHTRKYLHHANNVTCAKKLLNPVKILKFMQCRIHFNTLTPGAAYSGIGASIVPLISGQTHAVVQVSWSDPT